MIVCSPPRSKRYRPPRRRNLILSDEYHMNVSRIIFCKDFPCTDVLHDRFSVPKVELDPQQISVLMISEAAAPLPEDDFYAGESALFAQTTLLAFQDAGLPVTSIQEVIDRGIYLTSAVKCAKTAYGIAPPTVQACSYLLEQEIALFPNVKVFLLMGDVAIKAVNSIARRNHEPRPVLAGSTYKIPRRRFPLSRRTRLSLLPAGGSQLWHREIQAQDDRRGHPGSPPTRGIGSIISRHCEGCSSPKQSPSVQRDCFTSFAVTYLRFTPTSTPPPAPGLLPYAHVKSIDESRPPSHH